MQREQQAKLESSPRTENSERMFRSRVPRLDPREKDKLLYGYSRSADLYLSTSEPHDGGDSFQGTGTAVDDSHPVQLETNEAIVEITGTSVTIEWSFLNLVGCLWSLKEDFVHVTSEWSILYRDTL